MRRGPRTAAVLAVLGATWLLPQLVARFLPESWIAVLG
jgi:hypothetical protein